MGLSIKLRNTGKGQQWTPSALRSQHGLARPLVSEHPVLLTALSFTRREEFSHFHHFAQLGRVIGPRGGLHNGYCLLHFVDLVDFVTLYCTPARLLYGEVVVLFNQPEGTHREANPRPPVEPAAPADTHQIKFDTFF